MIDKGVICGKLSQLRERQKLLSELGSEPLDAFVTQGETSTSSAVRSRRF